MKLRNLFLASLAVCTMASCSKDDDANNGPREQVNAQISFVATTLTQQTKASIAGTLDEADTKTNETRVGSLTAYVFKKGGALAARETFTAEQGKTISEIKHITVKVTPGNTAAIATEDEFQMVLVANGETVNPSSLDDLKDKVLTSTIETYTPGTSDLPMISGVIEFKGLVPLVQEDGSNKENWVANTGNVTILDEEADAPSSSYTAISLTRMIARVQVDQLTIDIQKNYKGAIFTLGTLALANVRPLATATDGVKSGNDEYYKGYESNNFIADAGWISPNSSKKTALCKTYAENQPSYSESSTGGATTFIADFTAENNKDKQFVAYAFPNSSDATYYTGLIISGKFQRYEGAPEELKHFRVILQHPDGSSKVEGNYIYKLKITITGEGSKDENHPELNAHVAATIDVAPWNVIIQEEEDTN